MGPQDLPDEVKKLEKIVNNLVNSQFLTHGLGRALRRLSKEIVLYKYHVQGANDWQTKRKTLNPTKIQAGGGKNILEGFLNIDIVPPADLIYDVREGLPLEDECCEFIFSEHFLEHIDYPVSVKKFIKECFRILKPSGQVVTGVPDSKLAIESYIKKDPDFYKRALETWYSKRSCLPHFNTYIDLLNYHFRDQDDDEKYTPHLWAYDYEKLESLFKSEGFSKIEPWDFDESIANPERKYGSIYVIATK